MTRLRLLAPVLLVTALTVSACSGGCRSKPSSPAPNVLALVLEVQDTGVRVISATPSVGVVPTPSIDSRAAALRRRDSVWIDYVIRGGSDAALSTGSFTVSMSAIVERSTFGRGGLVRVSRRVVTVAVPYSAQATSITFSRAEPSDASPDKWQRASLGAYPLTIGARR